MGRLFQQRKGLLALMGLFVVLGAVLGYKSQTTSGAQLASQGASYPDYEVGTRLSAVTIRDAVYVGETVVEISRDGRVTFTDTHTDQVALLVSEDLDTYYTLVTQIDSQLLASLQDQANQAGGLEAHPVVAMVMVDESSRNERLVSSIRTLPGMPARIKPLLGKLVLDNSRAEGRLMAMRRASLIFLTLGCLCLLVLARDAWRWRRFKQQLVAQFPALGQDWAALTQASAFKLPPLGLYIYQDQLIGLGRPLLALDLRQLQGIRLDDAGQLWVDQGTGRPLKLRLQPLAEGERRALLEALLDYLTVQYPHLT